MTDVSGFPDAVTETARTADANVPKPRKGARGARFYRSSYAHMIEGIDVLLILAFSALALRELLPDAQMLGLSLAQVMPTGFAAMGLYWTLRENELYRLPASIGAPGQALRAFGALMFALPVMALSGVVGALLCGRPAVEGLEEGTAAFATIAMVLVAAHGLWGWLLRRLTRAGIFSLNIVMVGATDKARQLVEQNEKTGDLNVLGIFDDRLDRSPTHVGGAPVIGTVDALRDWPSLPLVDRVIVTVTSAAPARARALVDRLRALPNKVVLLLDLQGFNPQATTLAKVADAPVLYVSGSPENARRAFWKRVQDVAIGSLALAIFSPLMLLVALAIKLDSPGPIFFRQPRHGFNNERILVWKFRSMYAHRADLKAEQQTRANDPRVTRVGRFIRATSLDELPQLFNVLAGEMSLVGPRPHAIGMKTGSVASERLVDEYAHRHRIKPGMTGWAQINGSRGPVHTAEDVRERVRLDVEYIERANFWLDLWIMAATIPVLAGDAARTR